MPKPINILFVCSANKDRSKTAEDYFSLFYPDLNFESAGTNLKLCLKEGTNPISKAYIDRADVIFVMENKHKEKIKSFTKEKPENKITVLGIQDRYKYYQEELIDILMEKLDDQLRILAKKTMT